MVIFAHCTCCRPSRLQPGSVLDLAKAVFKWPYASVCPHALALLFRSLTAVDIIRASDKDWISFLDSTDKYNKAIFTDPTIQPSVEVIATTLLASVPRDPAALKRAAMLLDRFGCIGSLIILFRSLTAVDIIRASDKDWVSFLDSTDKYNKAIFTDPTIQPSVEVIATTLLASVPRDPAALKRAAMLLDRFGCIGSLNSVLYVLYTHFGFSFSLTDKQLISMQNERLWTLLEINKFIHSRSPVVNRITKIFHDRFQVRLRAYLCYLGVPKQDIKVLLNQVFDDLSTRSKQITSFDNLSSFLYKSVKYNALNYYRDKRRYSKCLRLFCDLLRPDQDDCSFEDYIPDEGSMDPQAVLLLSDTLLDFIQSEAKDSHRLTNIERFTMKVCLGITYEEMLAIYNRKKHDERMAQFAKLIDPGNDPNGTQRKKILDAFPQIAFTLRRLYQPVNAKEAGNDDVTGEMDVTSACIWTDIHEEARENSNVEILENSISKIRTRFKKFLEENSSFSKCWF